VVAEDGHGVWADAPHHKHVQHDEQAPLQRAAQLGLGGT
jgi:hypothetical protein